MNKGNVTGKLSFICQVDKDLGNNKYSVIIDPKNMKGFPDQDCQAQRSVYFEKDTPKIGNYYAVWSADLDENRNVFAPQITEVAIPGVQVEVIEPVARQENPDYKFEDVLNMDIPASQLVPKYIQC